MIHQCPNEQAETRSEIERRHEDDAESRDQIAKKESDIFSSPFANKAHRPIG